jgi:UDP-N-acetyl-D-glucosamine dehydrogenase
VPDLMESAQKADCVVIITDHSSYDYAALIKNARLIVDTRNALGSIGRGHPKVTRL